MKVPVKIVIPIYRSLLSEYEAISLKQAFTILGDYPIVIIKPESLDLSSVQEAYPSAELMPLNDSYFTSISSYNRLMLSTEFYQKFSDAEYILIYQLDAYVFKNTLQEWCNKGYDYVGAPWLVRPIYNFPLLKLTSWIKKRYCSLFHLPNGQITNFKVGNGGLSLRKVESHLKATELLKETIKEFLSYKKNHIFNEDIFFSIEVNKHGLDFLYPHYMEALQFSFDKYPELCYELNNKELPFGCHSWYKRKMKKFWLNIICPQK